MKAIAACAFILAVLAGAAGLMQARASFQRPSAPPSLAKSSTTPLGIICKADQPAAERRYPAWMNASFAQDGCWAPAEPGSVNGRRASREQVVATMAAVKRYAAAARSYQGCIRDFVAARREEAARMGKPVAAGLLVIESQRVLVSSYNSAKVVNRGRTTINQFNEYGSDCPD